MFKSMKTVGGILALTLFTATAAFAQVTTINGAAIFEREYNDDPTSVLTTVNNYPTLISFDEESVDKNGQTGGYANRDVWRFSDDSGVSPYLFSNDDFFEASMTLTLTGNASPRKEAGFLFDTVGGQGQFIVNTDAHEVVVFGGPFPFYAFPSTFNTGDTITLGMTYFLDTDGMRKIIYHAGSLSSPPLTFTNLEQGIISGTRLGGYMQTPINATNPNNFAKAVFQNITITPITGVTVSGTLTFEGLLTTGPAQNVTFTFRDTNGGPTLIRTISVPASGVFSLSNIPAGTYNLLIKGDHYLADNEMVDTTTGPVSNVTSTQFAGDANNDNKVDIGDFGLVVNAYGSLSTDPNSGYDAAVDFNGDGMVDIADFGLLVNNYGNTGAI